MHVQGGMRVGKIKVKYDEEKMEYKGSVYGAGPTFESYGVPHGSANLSKAVPEEHKKFLASLVWIHEEENVLIETTEGRSCSKLIAVHAGLVRGIRVDDQLKLLKAHDTRLPKVAALNGRHDVWKIPEEFSRKATIVVSGHHGKLHIDGVEDGQGSVSSKDERRNLQSGAEVAEGNTDSTMRANNRDENSNLAGRRKGHAVGQRRKKRPHVGSTHSDQQAVGLSDQQAPGELGESLPLENAWEFGMRKKYGIL